MNRQYTRDTPPISKTVLKQFYCIFLFFLLTFFFVSQSSANPEVTYGPIKKGQSLWTIAEETRPDNTVSIEQVVYAFYHLNPDAFQANNMNLLKTGSYISIPGSDVIKKVTPKEAKQSLSKHAHALALLRADAKQLKKSKHKTKKYHHQIKKIQQRLAKYRYESKKWNSTYKKLVKAKRRYAKSKRETRQLRKLLLEKSTIVATAVTKKPPAPKTDSIVLEKLTQIQGQLTHLEQSNQSLVDKSKNLDLLNKRIAVLEDELGITDQLVVQLKNVVESMQDDIKEQNKKADILQNSLKALKNHKHKENVDSNNNSDTTQQDANLQGSGSDTSDIESLRIKLSPKEQQTFAHLEIEEKPVVEAPLQELKETPQIEYHSSEIKHASFREIEIENTTYNKIEISSSYPHETTQNKKSDLPLTFITIGGYINGFILIFVLFILLFRRTSPH